MPPVDDFQQECRADNIHKMSGKNSTGEKVYGVGIPYVLIIGSHFFVIQILPKIGGIDSPVLHVAECCLYRVNIMNGKKAWNFHLPGHGRNDTGHPIIAVNQIRLDLGDDVIDHLALKSQGEFNVFSSIRRINTVDVIKGPVFCQMDAIIGHFALNFIELFF